METHEEEFARNAPAVLAGGAGGGRGGRRALLLRTVQDKLEGTSRTPSSLSSYRLLTDVF